MNKYEQHQEESRIQARQRLQNCAMLAAYVYGQPEGWYGIAAGHVNGFQNDYAVINGDFDMHHMRAFYIQCTEWCLHELEEIRAKCAEANEGERPLITILTKEEIAAAVEAVREEWSESDKTEGLEEWLRELCECMSSKIYGCNWSAVAAVVTEPHAQKVK